MLPDMVTDNQVKIQSQLPEPSSTCWCLLAAFFKLGLNLSLGTTLFVNTSVDTSSDFDLQDYYSFRQSRDVLGNPNMPSKYFCSSSNQNKVSAQAVIFSAQCLLFFPYVIFFFFCTIHTLSNFFFFR